MPGALPRLSTMMPEIQPKSETSRCDKTHGSPNWQSPRCPGYNPPLTQPKCSWQCSQKPHLSRVSLPQTVPHTHIRRGFSVTWRGVWQSHTAKWHHVPKCYVVVRRQLQTQLPNTTTTIRNSQHRKTKKVPYFYIQCSTKHTVGITEH